MRGSNKSVLVWIRVCGSSTGVPASPYRAERASALGCPPREGMTSYSTFFHLFSEPLMAAAMTCVVFWGVRWKQTKTPLAPTKLALAFLILWITEFLAVLAHDYLFAPHDSSGDRVLFRVFGAIIGFAIILSTRNFWDWPEQ